MKEIAEKIGLSEHKFQAIGGGKAWAVVIIIAIGAALLMEHD